jgi:hypothetical protein
MEKENTYQAIGMRAKKRTVVILNHFMNMGKVWKGMKGKKMKVRMKVEEKLAQHPCGSM